MKTEGETSPWDKVILKAWRDSAFKARLKANPVAVLRDQGIDLPPGVEVRVLEDSEHVVHLTLPARPPEQALTDEDLDKVAGGALDKGLVSTLSRYFGWSAGQLDQVLGADQAPTAPRRPGNAPSNGRSPPSLG